MSHSNDDKGGKKGPPDPPDATPADKRSGRVAFDSRGNPIWEWQLETGVYSRDVNTQKLKKLDLGELSIADSGIHQRPDVGSGQPAPPKMPGGGINPYDTGNRPGGIKPQDTGNRRGINPSDTANRPAGGFNPYDSGIRSGGTGSNPYDNARAMADRLKPEAPQERRRTPADLRKLDQQIKEQRKKLKE